MPNVTFIIGNGLDLSLGLKTTYRDFYENISKRKAHPNNRIYKAIEERPESWADFELALGRYTDYIDNLPDKDKKRESIRFHDELEELREDLADYLENQEKSLDLGSNDIRLKRTSHMDELSTGQKEMIDASLPSNQTVFQFISLNYTNTLEQIVHNSSISLKNSGVSYTKILHIHGDLYENLILGVSDESQLSSSMAGTEKDDLIKPSLIYSLNDGRMDSFKRMIDSSSVVVLFGTSIGETDRYIWSEVTEWLRLSPARHLIIHKHDGTYTANVRRSPRIQRQYRSSVQEQLLLFSGLDGNQMAEIKDRIFVIHNTKKLFAA